MAKDRSLLAKWGFVPAVVIAGLLLVFASATQAQIKHFGVSDVTEFVSCAEKVLHEHVLLHPNLPLQQVTPLCRNQSGDEFRASLKANSVAVKEDKNWAYLLPAKYFGPWESYTPEGEKLHWTKFHVEVSIANADPKDQQTEMELKPETLSKLKTQVLEQARLIPIFEPHTQSETEVAQIGIALRAYVRHTRKDGPVSLVLLMSEARDWAADGRMVYGEQQSDGSFQLLWDSPIVVAKLAQISFQDVDGDVVEEIVLRSSYPAGVRDLEAMSIFDLHGNELTRNLTATVESVKPHCAVPDLFGYSAADGACPIVGEGVDFDYSHGPPYDIVGDGTFTLRERRYVVPSLFSPQARPAKQPHPKTSRTSLKTRLLRWPSPGFTRHVNRAYADRNCHLGVLGFG
jgi:hypothetical protein